MRGGGGEQFRFVAVTRLWGMEHPPLLAVAVLPERPILAPDETVQRVVLRVEAPSETPGARQLVVVLDCSRSMRRFLPRATAVLSDVLAALPRDTQVSVVAFDEDLRVLTRDGDPDAPQPLGPQLAALTPGRGSNLGAALGRAFELAKRDGYAAHVLLLTDGHATVGIRPRGALVELVRQSRDHVTLSTIALADEGDADLQTLECLARVGGGSCHVASDADTLRDALAHESHALAHLAATDVELVVRTRSDVKLAKLWERGPAARDRGDRSVRLPRLVAGQAIDVALQLEWHVPNDAPLAVLELRVTYADGRVERRELPVRASHGARSGVDREALATVLRRRLDAAHHDAATDDRSSGAAWLKRRVALLRALAEQEHVVGEVFADAEGGVVHRGSAESRVRPDSARPRP